MKNEVLKTLPETTTFEELHIILTNVLDKDHNNNLNKFIQSVIRIKPLIPIIYKVTQFLHEIYPNLTTGERVHLILQNINSFEVIPKCPMCGKVCNFRDTKFLMSCGNRGCFQKHPDVIQKKHKTATENYGSLKEAYIKTMAVTVKEKYKVNNVSELDSVKEKKKETSRKNWGTDYPWQSEEGKQLQKQGVYDIYGVYNVSQSDDIKKKKEEAFMYKWGVRNPAHHMGIRSQILKQKDIKVVLQDGREYFVDDQKEADFLSAIYNNFIIDDVQPQLRIQYFDDKGVDHYWFPDAVIDGMITEIRPLFTLNFTDYWTKLSGGHDRIKKMLILKNPECDFIALMWHPIKNNWEYYKGNSGLIDYVRSKKFPFIIN
jgi:hypothetical protein